MILRKYESNKPVTTEGNFITTVDKNRLDKERKISLSSDRAICTYGYRIAFNVAKLECDQQLMPAGRYYIGDLCYVLDEDNKGQLSSLVFPVSQGLEHLNNSIHLQGVFRLFRDENGDKSWNTKNYIQVADFCTHHGDGQYSVKLLKSGNKVASLPVDSGAIGCVLIDDIPKEKIDDDMYFRTFKEPFRVGYDYEEGTIFFGVDDSNEGVYIKTG